ncbi:hypothetical protein K2173_022742 [Erythroxylum novogranatense]|uniref:Transmembrane protein n=1 Tax=Erythroxylum novogranatense TaxID=1862640 RepID=A0AAV8SMH0_9ROSI|nr:hypothetical protein K2173_022742 [Erythroxylum novogranatense]
MYMALKVGPSSFSCVASPLSSPCRKPKRSSQEKLHNKFSDFYNPFLAFQLCLSGKQCHGLHCCSHKRRNAKVNLYHCIDGLAKLRGKFAVRESVLFATTEEEPQLNGAETNASEHEDLDSYPEAPSSTGSSRDSFQGINGKPGFISFYNHPRKKDDAVDISSLQKKQSSLSWFVGPAVLVASFTLPLLYLRKILSMVFEDSLLTDFLILFFSEAFFYCGIAVFLLLVDSSGKPKEPKSSALHGTSSPLLGQRISSVTALVLSLLLPMVTMGLVWPWTGPAASATLAPYLVGIVVQFAFEQYARYRKSPSLHVIPIIFQVYRLHQLNRAAQLVTALSFTVRGAEMTSHNIEISNSLITLLNVLQILGVICIWSLSSFLVKVFPSTRGVTD